MKLVFKITISGAKKFVSCIFAIGRTIAKFGFVDTFSVRTGYFRFRAITILI